MYACDTVLLILASYDYESLQLTLRSLDHTLSGGERTVIILNGNQSLNARIVEYVGRTWASQKPDARFVVKPLVAPSEPYFAINEVIRECDLVKGATYICKIDDDIIPLRKGWLQHLRDEYSELALRAEIGFVTGLITNNCWGFKELVTLYNRQAEYENIHCYRTIAGWNGSRVVEKGEIDDGEFGTIWQYPFIARWLHQWTSLVPGELLEKTGTLFNKRIPQETYYSIGCIFFKREFWLSLDAESAKSKIDEKIIHSYCLATGLQKWAIMDEPILHLFYNSHRLANSDLLIPIAQSLAVHFDDHTLTENIHRLQSQFSVAITNQWQRVIDDIAFTKDKLYNFLSNAELV